VRSVPALWKLGRFSLDVSVNVERRAKKEAVKCVMIADSSFHMQSAPPLFLAPLSHRRPGRLLRILINSAGGAASSTSISGIPSEEQIM
jgi:hypothetical protein